MKMKQSQQIVLDQLKAAMGRAHPHIHEPINSDSSAFQNMVILRGYLDALWEALRANHRMCEASDSMYRSRRAGLDLAGRVLHCRNYCIDLGDALARKDEETLRIMRVHQSTPLKLLSKKEYGDPKEDKEENKEYFQLLDAAMEDVDGYLVALTGKWMRHFGSRYEKPQRPEVELREEKES